jgi:hypothetical protein
MQWRHSRAKSGERSFGVDESRRAPPGKEDQESGCHQFEERQDENAPMKIPGRGWPDNHAPTLPRRRPDKVGRVGESEGGENRQDADQRGFRRRQLRQTFAGPGD